MARRVTFTEDGARRIVNAVRGYERGNRDQPPIKFRDVGDDGGGGLFVAEFTGDWAYDTYKSIGEPGETIEVLNRLVGVRVGPGGGTYNTGNVTYAKLGENYYAVAFNLTRLEGYPSGPVSGLSHVLGLVDGLLQWVDTAVCPEPELPPE